MRDNLISALRTMAKFYNISYPATAKLLREAACELEEAARIMEITTGDAATDIEKKLLSATWLNKPTKTN